MHHNATATPKVDAYNSGWSTETSYSYDDTCDIDIIDHDIAVMDTSHPSPLVLVLVLVG